MGKLVNKPVYIITTGEPGTSHYHILTAFTDHQRAVKWVERRTGSGPFPIVIEIYDTSDNE